MQMIPLYNILIFIVIIIAFPVLLLIVLLSDKRRKTALQRMGLTQLPHSSLSSPIWVHALSVGETLSAAPLVKQLKEHFRDRNIVFSVSTKTGFEIANEIIKQHADAVFFFPYDFIFSVKHIINKTDPCLVVIVETDIWPNFLSEMKKRDIPVFLVNTRLSKKSFSGYKRFSFFIKPVFMKLAKICTQSQEDARRFENIGIPPSLITVTGNIKFDQESDPVSDTEIKNMRQSMKIESSQKIILAGSTHEGEETILLDVFSRLRKKYDDILMIIPRDPDRGRAVCRISESLGFSSAMMSELDKTDANIKNDVIVVNVIGILRKLYSVADIAFIGGSLVNFGGHNPLEPAVFSKPIIFGPYMSDFAQISEILLESGGAVQVKDADNLYETAEIFLTDTGKAKRVGDQAFKIFCSNKGAVERTLKVLEENSALKE
ncbi:MAG: 3-deoxy-D-manno-octulosonic acid transferase [Desulfobacteraceae bacterium]|nr:3-deoxy-D-manno-octulosonic acid transferase [Desulfobacteraceae bacterium]